MLVWEGAMGKLMQVEYTACDLVWVLQAGYLDSFAQQLTPKTQAAPLVPRQAVAYEGVTLLPAMVCRRDLEVVCCVLGCGKTVPLGRIWIDIAFHVHSAKLHPPCRGFCGKTGCVLRMRRVKGGGGAHAQPVFCANGFFWKVSMRAACKPGVQPLPVECPVQGCGWQWRHNMRRHCEQQHADHQLLDERTAQWGCGSEELSPLKGCRGLRMVLLNPPPGRRRDGPPLLPPFPCVNLQGIAERSAHFFLRFCFLSGCVH